METIIIASLATIGSLCVLAICILVILLVLRHHDTKHQETDLETGQDKVTATLVKNENIVVISDQSYYCMIGSPASDTDSQADTSDEDTITSSEDTITSSEDSRSLDDQNMTYTVKKEEKLEVSLMKENELKIFKEKKENMLNSSLRSLNLSQMVRETEQTPSEGKPKEKIQKYNFESVDIETEQSEISFINIENSLEKDLFLSNEKFLMSPQVRKDLELIEKKIFLKSGKPNFKPFTVLGILNRFSYFYCLGLDMTNITN